ncbi:MAG: S8 family serine peptidase [Nanohaloarchaea archaeon]|nr:S8 family serine peptidase [Candidatus Nanohaloarchaea archaeon]
MADGSWRLLGLILLILLLVSTSAGKVNLKSGAVEPEKPSISAFGTQTEPGYHILEFDDIPNRSNGKIKGVELMGYIPKNAYYADLTSSAVERLETNPKVNVLDINPEDRISPSIKDRNLSSNTEKNTFLIEFFNNTGQEEKEEFVERTGELVSRGKKSWKVRTEKEPSEFAKGPVKWISPPPPPLKVMNDGSRDMIEVDRLKSWDTELNGSGVRGAVWDGGWAAQHVDLNYSGKTVRGDSGCTESACSVSDHATHVAGTVLGAGKKNPLYRGIAPNATLASYEWPADYSELVNEHKDAVSNYDAEVSQNSWGFDIGCSDEKDILGAYTQRSAGYDDVVAGETSVERIPVVFSAGNLGECSGDGSTLTGPGATAKNTIVVGSLDGSGKRSSFSSYGPTDDGRIKPDLMAKGEVVTSTVPGNSYAAKQGTSMSSPAVSGAILLLQQEFRELKGRNATPSELKGLMIHTATDLNSAGPSYKTGWGLLNVSRSIDYLRADKGDLIKRGSVLTGEKDSYSLDVEGSANLTLVWSDPAAESSSGFNLVNNLDLIVKNSMGQRFYPWTLNSSRATKEPWRNKSDDLNNVEKVYIPESGDLTVEVKGSSVPEIGQQDYTLLLEKERLRYPNITIESPNNTTYTDNSAYFNISTDMKIEKTLYAVDYGSNISMQNDTETHFYDKRDGLSEGFHNATFYAKHSSGGWNSSSINFTVDTVPPDIRIHQPKDRTYSKDELSINYTSKDANQVLYSNGSENKTLSGNKTFEFEEGYHDIILYVEDEHGNVNSTNRSFRVDTVPKLSLYSPQNRSYPGSFDLRYSVDQETTVEYNNGSDNKTITGNTSLDLEDGRYNLVVYATDPNGNTAKESVGLTVDTSKPNITVNEPAGKYREPFGTINISVNDSTHVEAVAEVRSEEDGKKNYTLALNNTYHFNNTVKFKETSYNLTYFVEDDVGNLAVSNSSLEIDSIAPTLKFSTIENTTYTTEKIWANISSNEDLKSADLYINGTSKGLKSKNSSFYYSRLDLKPGKTNITVNGTDKFNNTRFKSEFFTIENLAPKITNLDKRDVYKINDTVNLSYKMKEETPDTVKLKITYPNSTTETRKLGFPGENPYPSGFRKTELFNKTAQRGNYTAKVIVNDTYSKRNTLNETFEVRKPVNLTLRFKNGKKKNSVQHSIRGRNFTLKSSNTSAFNESIPEGVWDLEVGNNSNVELREVKISKDTNTTVNWSEDVSTDNLERKNTEFKEVIAADTDLNFSEAGLTIKYAETDSPKLLKCDEWSFERDECDSDWREIDSGEVNSTVAKTNVSSFSAYAVAEETESSTDSSDDSGGSGGGSSGGGSGSLTAFQQEDENQIQEERTVENDQAVFRNINISRDKKLDLEGLEGINSLVVDRTGEERINLTITRQMFEAEEFNILNSYSLDSSLQNSRFIINFSVSNELLNGSKIDVYVRRDPWQSIGSNKMAERSGKTHFSAVMSAPTEFAIGVKEIESTPAEDDSTLNNTEEEISEPEQQPRELVLPVVASLLLVLFACAGYLGFRMHRRKMLKLKLEQISKEIKNDLQEGGELPKDSIMKVEHAQKAMELGRYTKTEKILEDLESEL